MQQPYPPRRKLRPLWIFAGLFALFGLWFCYQLFGPSAAIVISKETTYITEPLAADGLPNYEAYWLQRDNEGVTPENNAAVLIWQAMWPGDLEQKHWLAMCDALGIEEVPSQADALVPVYSQSVQENIALELAQKFSDETKDRSEEDYFNEEWQRQIRDYTASELIDQASSRPWASKQSPALAAWIKQNQKPLDLLVEASKRPRYFSPSPSSLNGSEDMLLAMLLPDIQMMRDALRALIVRAMWHMGEGRTAEAWQDLLACHRLARLTSQNNTLVGQLVAIAIEGVTSQGTISFLHHSNLDAKTAREILTLLDQLGKPSDCIRCLDQGERLCFLDTAITLARGREGISGLAGMGGGPSTFDKVVLSKVNWNVALRDGNLWYNRMVAAAKLPTREERQTEFALIDNEIMQQSSQVKRPSSLIAGALHSGHRSKLVSNILSSLMLPATSAAFSAENRANALLELTRLAAALAVYRAEQGEYPVQLSDLVPAVLEKLPLDLYSEKPFIYQRKDDGGYLLYSVFENGVDDGGTDLAGEIIKGEWVDEQPDDFDYSESDLVIRVPLPKFKFPTPPKSEEYGFEYGGEFGSEFDEEFADEEPEAEAVNTE